MAVDTHHLARRAAIVAELARLERKRLLQWVLAYAGLSAAWAISDDGDPALPLAVAGLAAAAIG